MKTSETIEAQEERKAARDNRNDVHSSREITPPVKPKLKQRDASRIAAWRWPKGRSANPGGRPRHDIAKEIAEAIFLNNTEMIYKAYCKVLRRGSPYAFQVLSERAFGKLKERHEVEVGQYRDQSEEALLERVRELEKELGVVTPQVLPPGPKPN